MNRTAAQIFALCLGLLLLQVPSDASPPDDVTAIVTDSQGSVSNSASATFTVSNAGVVNIWTTSLPADLTTVTISQVRYVTIQHIDETDTSVGVAVKVSGTNSGITPSVLTYATGYKLNGFGDSIQVNLRRPANGSTAAQQFPINLIGESATLVDVTVTYWW